MKHLFISYRSLEVSKAQDISRIEISSVDWWLDKHDIPPSADWWAEICKNIEMCHAFTLLLSKYYLESIFCLAEMNYALQLKKPIICLFLDDTPIPSELANIQGIKAQNWNIHHIRDQIKDALIVIPDGFRENRYLEDYTTPRPNRPNQPTTSPKPKPKRNRSQRSRQDTEFIKDNKKVLEQALDLSSYAQTKDTFENLLSELDLEDENIAYVPAQFGKTIILYFIKNTDIPLFTITNLINRLINDPYLHGKPELNSLHQLTQVDSEPAFIKQMKSYLSGWQKLDTTFFKRVKIPPVTEQKAHLLNFFNGGSPDWFIITSGMIPKRPIVDKAMKSILDGSRLNWLNIMSATCEGKTTALMQIAYQLYQKPNTIVYWMENGMDGCNSTHLMSFYEKNITDNQTLFLFVDDPDRDNTIILSRFMAQLKQLSVRNVQIIVAVRQEDWRFADGNEIATRHSFVDNPLVLQGIESESEASLIVQAWESLGDEGLGGLVNIPASKRAKTLLEKTQNHYRLTPNGFLDGSFLGAMLDLRIKRDLSKHIHNMLQRLKQRHSPKVNLFDLYIYIIAPHGELFEKLTFRILSSVMKMTERELRLIINEYLAGEALVFGHGRFITGRHIQISRVVKEILIEEGNGFMLDEALADLAVAARRIYIDTPDNKDIIPDIQWWSFKLPEQLHQSERTSVAQNIVFQMVEIDKKNRKHFMPRLAGFLTTIEEKVNLFRDMPVSDTDRAFYRAWAMYEYEANDYDICAYVCGLALDDRTYQARTGDKEYWISIIVYLTKAWAHLYKEHPALSQFEVAYQVSSELLDVLNNKKGIQFLNIDKTILGLENAYDKLIPLIPFKKLQKHAYRKQIELNDLVRTIGI